MKKLQRRFIILLIEGFDSCSRRRVFFRTSLVNISYHELMVLYIFVTDSYKYKANAQCVSQKAVNTSLSCDVLSMVVMFECASDIP